MYGEHLTQSNPPNTSINSLPPQSNPNPQTSKVVLPPPPLVKSNDHPNGATTTQLVAGILTGIIAIITIYEIYEAFHRETTSKSTTDNVFFYSFTATKVGLLLFLGIGSIIYYTKYKDEIKAGTELDSYSYRWRVLADILVAGIFGALSVLVIFASRSGTKSRLVIFLVACILALFELVKESSGFNRYLSSSDIEQCKGPYYYIDSGYSDCDPANTSECNTGQINKKVKYDEENKTSGCADPDLDPVVQFEKNADPFVHSTGTSWLLGATGFIVFILILVMFYCTYKGFKSGNHNLKPEDFSWPPWLLFSLEVVLVAGLSAVPPLVTPLILREKYSTGSFGIAIGFFILVVVLQIMFQYNGLL